MTDPKVRILAVRDKLVFLVRNPLDECPPHETNIHEAGQFPWHPMVDGISLGNVITDTKKNLGASLRALELLSDIKPGRDAIGDVDWFRTDDDGYAFSWMGPIQRVLLVDHQTVAARGYAVHASQCQVIANDIPEEYHVEIMMATHANQPAWSEPFWRTYPGDDVRHQRAAEIANPHAPKGRAPNFWK